MQPVLPVGYERQSNAFAVGIYLGREDFVYFHYHLVIQQQAWRNKYLEMWQMKLLGKHLGDQVGVMFCYQDCVFRLTTLGNHFVLRKDLWQDMPPIKSYHVLRAVQ